ncbi:hypothetical protein FHS89_000761 [Rubricella aquisinus]|uniref:DUF2155 domain-containing protein n=1 Tax=Rubricella aquisinus TaxID=2028108 RepID=A0A840WYK4_9RHOB|nr:DUF2155 domain-containing protein [Rubricella aquisinus]MBB5514755.1 hypothetical protein [Rubricella aquisinus]
MRKALLILALLASGAQAQVASTPLEPLVLPDPVPDIPIRPDIALEDRDIALLRGLDKMTALPADIVAPVGETVQWERLEIHVAGCRATAEGEKPDAYAWLSLRDIRHDAPDFQGWMIASSPALSAMDHPRYDIWVARCITSAELAAMESAPQSE